MARAKTVRKIAWFVALWLASVAALGLVASLIKLVI